MHLLEAIMMKRFPFDCIVITSPDEASAQSVNGPLSFLKRRILEKYPSQNIQLTSTFDPFGARCGSGGGTIAALEYTSPGQNVLILHAGGDSSRCPTQMILGKSWTNLPNARYRNPTIWLIDQLILLWEVSQFPRGTLIVAATDCLLKFFDKQDFDLSTWSSPAYTQNSVIGVAVPAPLTTAKNHGVYILPESVLEAPSDLTLVNPLDVWQKPTKERLTKSKDPAPASFHLPLQKERQAWIDTGLVIFLPEAVQKLYDLADGVLARCTRKGLTELYKAEKKRKLEEPSLEDFAKENALKIDIYTDILHNLSWPGQSQSPNPQKSSLQEALSQIPLKILVAPEGAFLHLGTSMELLSFFTSDCEQNVSDDDQISMGLSGFDALKPRFLVWGAPRANKNVALQSTFPKHKTSIGENTFVEYSDLQLHESVSIGRNCIVSGWKNRTQKTMPLAIPDDLCVQFLSLKNDRDSVVFMVIGIRDPIKTQRQNATIFGLSSSEFEKKIGTSLDKVGWMEQDSMWTAKLHPKVPAGTSFDSVYGWLSELTDDLSHNESFKKWLSSPRVSLKELHGLANADAEWRYRRELEKHIVQLQQADCIPNLNKLLRNRRHNWPCNFQWLLEIEDRETAKKELSKILVSLERIVLDELKREYYDVCGRAFMIASALLADFDASIHDHKDSELCLEITNSYASQIEVLRSSSTRKLSKKELKRAIENIIDQRRKHMGETSDAYLMEYSLIMERLALSMHELCVAGGFYKALNRKKWITERSNSSISSKWVISMAPARVDFAGGWSDTPPISYEAGGAVTGMAVLVDGKMPLSCRCRTVPDKSGILLRSEIRDINTGSLSSSMQTELSEISQLNNFRNPLADCALIKTTLIVLGLASEEDIHSHVSLQSLINKFCLSSQNVRLEIVTTSLLPKGSGMGTSSILGGCALGAIAKCVGIGELDDTAMVHSILMLEQLLSSGGGWQDQVHGLTPGIKTVRSKAGQFPMDILIEKLCVDDNILRQLEQRLVLAFTGKTRLAKNILQHVLRRWARGSSEIVDAVHRLIKGADVARSALINGDLDLLAKTLLEYERLKVLMAGEDSVVEPKVVKNLVAELKARDIIKGHALCGAGGGGFLIMLASEGHGLHDISNLVQNELSIQNEALKLFTWHECRISNKGLTTHIIQEDNLDVDAFELSWQSL